jgi:2-octaprenylphenol hydroxylase
MKNADFDIAVCGAGMVGATLAALLLNEPSLQALRIALIEPHLPTRPPGSDIDIRVSAVSRASQRILTRAGAWSLLPAAQLAPYGDMVVWDAHSASPANGSNNATAFASRPEREALRFSASSLGEPDLGHIIANHWLQWAALDACQHERLTRFNAELASISIDSDTARLTLSDGRRCSARLIIGADGARSVSRDCVGIAVRHRAYQQTALVTHVHTERPHQQTAWQRFLPRGPIAFLPLNDGRSSIVWTTTPEQATDLLAMDEHDLARQIADAADHVLGEVSVAAPRDTFPLQQAQVDEYCRHRFVLVGDAAHSIHPLAGQGVNLGLMDAATLVQVFSEARAGGASIEALSELRVLRRYERWRKTENTLAIGFVDAINKLFSNDQVGISAVRRTGLRAIAHAPLIKRMLMLRALGLAGNGLPVVNQP